MKNFISFLLSLFTYKKPPFVPPEIKPIPVLPTLEPILPPDKGLLLYNEAVKWLGKDVTPADRIKDDVDCADTVNTLYKLAFGEVIATPGDSTIQLNYVMSTDKKRFQKVELAQRGDIVIGGSYFTYGNLVHGHVCIAGKDGKLMSNDSSDGLFKENYTLDSFRKHCAALGISVIIYRPI